MKPIPLPMAELKTALTGLGKVISKRTTLPILATVKIERTSEGWIALTVTDLDHFVTVRLEQPTDGEPASVLVPFEDLVKTSKACGKNDTLLIRSEKNASVLSGIISYPIGGQMVEHRCTTFDVEEFPPTPRVKGDSVTLNDTVRSSIHDAFECASDDETRLVLNGVYLDVSKPEGHYVVATDGRQLFSSNSFKLELPQSLLLPTHKFIGWKEFNQDGEWQLKVGAPEKKDEVGQVQLTSRRWRFISRQIEGNYPNWRQVLLNPADFKTTITLAAESLDQIVQTIGRIPCHDDVNHTIGLEVKGPTLALLGKSKGADEWTRFKIESAKITGESVTIALNRQYLAKALKFGLNTIEIINGMSPLRLSHEGRQMIVMPIRADASPKHQPVATPPAEEQPAAPEAAQPERNNDMNTSAPATNGNGTNGHAPVEEKSSLELALDQIETIKGSYRDAVKGLNGLTDTLKQVQRDQKASIKEVQSVRTTLERLQTMKL